jgi:ABC-type phosphate transport system substrate-binding protein
MRLNRGAGRLGRPRSRLATLVTVGTVTLGLAGFAVASAGPASADPHQVYTTVGSDTIQDVMNQYALDLGVNTLGSWNAVDPVTNTATTPPPIITPNNAAGGQCSMSRPNGSGQGLAALRKSINPNTTATQLPAPPQPNCIDFSRSSSGPGTNQSNTGALVYIPFALDAVTIAAGSATTVAQANNFTLANLQSLYTCNTVTVNGVTYNPGTGGNIDLYIPQSGSGTLSFWATTMGFSTSALPPCLHQTIVAGPNTGTIVEEHDGLAVTSDPNGIGPFSIAQWISQRNGHNDRRHSAILQKIGGTFPCAGSSNCTAAGTTLNSAFPVTREVYLVVPFNKVTSGMTGFDPALAQLLAGGNSNLCQDIFTIQGFGFALLGSGTTDLCGSTANSLRAFDPATNPV